MHESSLLQGLLRQLEEIAGRESPGGRITTVHLRLGALASFSPEHLREGFRHLARGSVAEGAELAISVADDITDPAAQSLVLERVELDSGTT